MRPERLARLFHETYESLAPAFGYATRAASRKPWESVPESNKMLMIAVAKVVCGEIEKGERKAYFAGFWECRAVEVHREAEVEAVAESAWEAYQSERKEK